MFNLFGKKDTTKVIDKVWIANEDKLQGCLTLLKEKPSTIFIAWFDNTVSSLNTFLEQHHYHSKIISYKQATSVHNDDYVFVEHYPLLAKENELYKKLELKKAMFYIALDEPLYKQFGSEKIAELLPKLGMNKNESIEHAMISTSIKRAQEKIASKVLLDSSARSQQDWLNINVKD